MHADIIKWPFQETENGSWSSSLFLLREGPLLRKGVTEIVLDIVLVDLLEGLQRVDGVCGTIPVIVPWAYTL